MLFNVYLEEALKSSTKLEAVRKRGDLLAFAEDMLIMTNNQNELVMVIEELSVLQQRWNLRLKKEEVGDTHEGGRPGGRRHQIHQDGQVLGG